MLFYKDPSATLDFGIDWSSWLETAETISTSAWAVDDVTLTIGTATYAPTNSGTETKVWLSSGTVGTVYRVTNTITTDNTPARITERSFDVKLVQR
jgi:hypothetical protein